MTDNDVAALGAAEQEAAGSDLDVQLAQELIERAREQGVSLVRPDGLLPGVTRAVL